jgi:uncharacterized protein YggE
MFRTFFTAAALATALSTSAFAEDIKVTPTFNLSGHGEVRMAPDMASVSLGVFATAPTAREALDSNTASMKALMDTLKAAGVEEKDIQTSNFMVSPRLDYGNNNSQPPKVVGYDVSNQVTVIVRKLGGLGGLLDQAVTAGSNQVNGITFQISKPEQAEDEARKAAVADARHKAEIYAAATGVKLGNILTLSEGGGYNPPSPIVFAKAARMESASDVPVAQGEQVVSMDVTIVWEIK